MTSYSQKWRRDIPRIDLQTNLLLAKLHKFVAMKDTVGFVRDTETIEDLNGWSTPNESRNAENAKMISLLHIK